MWNFRIAKIRWAPIFKSCVSKGVWSVFEQLSYYEEIFNFKKWLLTSIICLSFPIWLLWWRKARWYFDLIHLISVVALLLSGGLYNSSVVPMNFVELWSPDHQCSLDPLPIPVEGHTMDWVDNSLVACGGLNGSWTAAPCVQFKNGTWQPLKNTKHPRWILETWYFILTPSFKVQPHKHSIGEASAVDRRIFLSKHNGTSSSERRCQCGGFPF